MVKSRREATSTPQDDWPALSPVERAAQFRELPHDKAEDFFRELSSADQADLLAHLPPAERRIWARALPPDDAADCIQASPGSLREELLGYFDEPARREAWPSSPTRRTRPAD